MSLLLLLYAVKPMNLLSEIFLPGFEEKIKALAAKRNLADLSIGPVLTWTTERMLEHVRQVAAIPGAAPHHVPTFVPQDLVCSNLRITILTDPSTPRKIVFFRLLTQGVRDSSLLVYIYHKAFVIQDAA